MTIVRDLELVLLADGTVELNDVTADQTLWSSDSDEDFQEEFPEVVDENDIENVIDYLCEIEELSDEEADRVWADGCVVETLEKGAGPGDEEDDDEDEDVHEYAGVAATAP
jgi:hypothetical protein